MGELPQASPSGGGYLSPSLMGYLRVTLGKSLMGGLLKASPSGGLPQVSPAWVGYPR